MFIYIDNINVIKSEHIISILEYELVSISPDVEQLINSKKDSKKVCGDQKEAKSIIVTEDFVYFSPLSTFTLKKRKDMFSTINFDLLESY